MLKLLGSVCVLTAGVLIQYRQVTERRRQRQLLQELAAALEAICSGIRVGRHTMPRLLQMAERNCRGGGAAFFGRVRLDSEACGLVEAWRTSADRLVLNNEEKETLKEVAEGFGGDEERICSSLLAAAERLRREAERRQEQAADAERRTAALYMSASALIIILLI